MKDQYELQDLLRRIDRKGYPAYKETRGQYDFKDYILSIDHVQGDPFAAPSKISLTVKQNRAGYPTELYDTKEKRIALQDYILRCFSRAIYDYSFKAKGSGKSGLMSVSRPGQEILERSACELVPSSGDLVVRMEIGFPANGRTVNSRELEKIFFQFLPESIKKSLYCRAHSMKELKRVADLAEDQTFIREKLKELGLVAFIADGSILPRESGVSMKPMKDAVAFSTPDSMAVELELPHKGKLRGMGIKRGITLIVGGGYHGKSTLLNAIELGIYDHIEGDGREFVITDKTAVKLRAEDGRSIRNVDISMFINNLPNGKDTVHFSTEDASGSTSQAANVIEAMESGSSTFLIDEDTSATNFMIRDELMQRVVNRASEPITPFVDRICQLYEQYGISTILVAGSSGSYFHKADTIFQMDCYKPVDITEFAKSEAEKFPIPTEAVPEMSEPDFNRIPERVKLEAGKGRGGNDRIKVKTTGCDTITINHDNIDMRYVEQLADNEQMSALGFILTYIIQNEIDGRKRIKDIVDSVENKIEKSGFSGINKGGYLSSNLARPRRYEIFACLNRYRKIILKNF